MTTNRPYNRQSAAVPPTRPEITEYYISSPLNRTSRVLKAVTWRGNSNHLTSLRFHYDSDGDYGDGPLYGGTGEDEAKTVTFGQTLRNMKASYYNHTKHGWIIKSLTFVTTTSESHVAGPPDANDTKSETRSTGDIVDVLGTYRGFHKVNWCL